MLQRMRAEGNLSKLLWVVVGAVVVVGVATWLEPWIQEYEIKTAARLTCSEVFKTRFQLQNPDEFFLGKATRAGVRFSPADKDPDCATRVQKDAKCYFFLAEHDKQARRFRCEAIARYQTSTQAAFVGHILQEIPPLVLQHKVKVTMDVADDW